MGLFDSIFGGTPARKSTSGPHVTRNRKNAERRQRMAETDAAVQKNTDAANVRKGEADAAAKVKALAERKKKIGEGIDFYKKILKKK